MTIDSEVIKAQALKSTRDILADSLSFSAMPEKEQRALFKDIYNQQVSSLSQAPAVEAMKKVPKIKDKKASDLIEDERHYNKRIEEAGQMAGDFVRQVNFPQFVSDLLKGVFDANLEVTLKQMDSYQQLLKTASASISKFVQQVDDAAAFGYLAENNADEFSIDFSDEEKDDTGQPKAVLTDKDGTPLDIGDNQVKAKIMDAKIAMAKEQRKLLRETILMGITRLVVEKGNVKAAVIFDIKAKEQIKKTDKAASKQSFSAGAYARGSTGLIGKIFGGGGAGGSSSYRSTQISVSSAKSEASTELAAKITGSVDITFKSDYFKLDNFMEIELADIKANSPGTEEEKKG